jgi:hypothetical protein
MISYGDKYLCWRESSAMCSRVRLYSKYIFLLTGWAICPPFARVTIGLQLDPLIGLQLYPQHGYTGEAVLFLPRSYTVGP